MKIIFGLSGLNAAELHGNLNQLQRLDALEQFRDGQVNYLLATDVASRGLDIIGIETVINYSMPGTEAIYVHRVGRTARAGKKGRALSLIGESGYERSLLKSIVKHSPPNTCKHRVVSRDSVVYWKEKVAQMGQAIIQVNSLEREEKAERVTTREIDKVENLLTHDEEIHSRPARTWFISESTKLNIKSEEKRVKQELYKELNKDNQKEKVEGEQSETETKLSAPKEYRPAAVPSLPLRPSRKERRKKEAQETMLTPSRYNLTKKMNSKIKRKSSKKKSPTPPAKRPKLPSKRQRLPGLDKPKKKSGFKSKKRHKRR